MCINVYQDTINIQLKDYIKFNNIDINENNNIIKKKCIKGRYPIDMLREIVYFHEKLKNKYGENTSFKINNIYISTNIVKYKKDIKKIFFKYIINNKSSNFEDMVIKIKPL